MIPASNSSHGLKSNHLDLAANLPFRPFSSTSIAAAIAKKQRYRYRDPYAEKQARARRLANISRQEVIREKRAEELGDPIRGITTPFVESFDTAIPQPIEPDPGAISTKTTPEDPTVPPPSPANALQEEHLNHFLTNTELKASLEYSRMLTEPLISDERATADPQSEADAARQHRDRDKVAREAVSRITSLANSNSRQRTLTNVQRCIDTFGRHNTDQYLKPKPKAPRAQQLARAAAQEPVARAGPDTGSSEVQIAILTAKIRVLANEYEGVSRNDKVNKRNLRLLLHRRQKLLQYMQRRERGGERWQNLIRTLGLTEATWKGQIAVES